MPVQFKDYYEVLGVPRNASDDAIKKVITEGQGKMKPIKTVSGKAADDVVGHRLSFVRQPLQPRDEYHGKLQAFRTVQGQQLDAFLRPSLAMESASQYGHVGGLAILDPTTRPGGIDLASVQELIGQRLPLVPPLFRLNW